MRRATTKVRLDAVLLVLVLVVGGAAYYAYSINDQLQQDNNRLGFVIKQLEANLTSLKGQFSILDAQRSPLVLLRTWGLALASYHKGIDGKTYLRLTETGSSSGVEAVLAATPFNATIPGNYVQWSAAANAIATDHGHTIWPMVLENSPGGTNALEFEMKDGFQEIAAMSNGIKTILPVSWNPNATHLFKIVIVVPGQKASFYIDGVLVGTIAGPVPKSDFLLSAAEVKADLSNTSGIAILDVYGGLLPQQ